MSKLSLGIGAVTTALTVGYVAWNAWKKSVEEARQRADDAGESLKSTASNIDEYKTKITELKTSISSGSLSKDEEYNAKVQLLSIQDELIEKYGSEAEQLNILTASSDAYCASLDNITQAEARANLRDNGKEYDKAIDEMTKEREFKINLGGIEDTDKALEILKDTLSENSNISLNDAWGGVKELSITGDAQDVQAALESLYDTLEQSNAEGHYFDNLKQMISGDLSQMDDVVSEFGSRYEAAIETRIMSGYDNGISAKAADNIDAYIASIKDAIAKGDFGAAQENWNLLTAEDLLDGIKDDQIRQYLQDKIDEATSGDFETQIQLGLDFGDDTEVKKKVLEYLSNFEDGDGVVDVSALLDMDNGNFISATNEQIAAYNILKEVADSYGLSVSDLVQYLSSLGVVQTSANSAMESAGLAASEAQKSVEALASAYSTLATAMKEMQSGGLSSGTALDIMSQLETAGKDYTDYLSVENGKLKLNTAAWIKYANEKNKLQLDGLKDQRDTQQQTVDNMSQGADEDAAVYTKRYTEAVNSLNALNSQIEIYEALVNDATNATGAFFDAYSAGESKMNTISDIIDALNTGGATQSQALEWIQQIPELANYYDFATNTFTNMDEALTGIVESDVNSYLSDTATYLQENSDMADESKVALLGLADAYKSMSTNTLMTGKAWGVLNKNVTTSQKPFKQLKTQISNLWNSDVFADARADLVALAKKTGVTSADVMDLAENNIYLQAMLSETGVSAQYLAKIFESLSLSGSAAFDSISDDAIRVNAVLSEMEGPLQKVSLAYDKYKSTLGTWEYDDSFDNYQEAYKNLGEMFKNGEFGADFYRTIDYLYGEGHGADGVENLYKKYKQLGQVFSEDDNGLGFIQKLYNEQSKFGGDFVKLDSSGKYIWDIGPEDFAGIAAGLGMTEDEVAACVEALGMFGDFTEYDPSKLVDTFKDLNMALTDTEGNTIASEAATRRLLESLGKEPWQIDQIIAKLKESNEIKFFDSSDVDDVNEVIGSLQELGKLKVDGDKIGINSLTAALKSLGMSNAEIELFMRTLDELGYHFTAPAGNILELNDAIAEIDGTPLDVLRDSAEAAQRAFNELHSTKLDINFDTEDIDYIDDELSTLRKMKAELVNSDGTIKIGMEESYDQINAMMYSLLRQKDSLQQPFIMSVDVSDFEGEVYSLIGNLQTLYSLTQEKSSLIQVGADTSGVDSQIDATIASINNANPEIKASFGIDESSGLSSLFAAMGRIKDQASLEEIMLKAGVDQTEIDTFLGTEHDADGTVTFDVDDSEVRKYRVPMKPGIAEYTARSSSQLVSWTPPTKYGKIEYVTGSQSTTKVSTVSKSAVKVNGTAHASGNWGTKKSETALTGELGPEIVVDPNSGSWYTVGDNGAQFADIPKGAIIFNHKQTESLLKYGKVAGRGKSYVTGSGGGINPATGKAYKSSYTSSKTSSKSSSKSSSSSGSSDAEAEAQILDWIETLIDRIERKISRLDTVASSSFRTMEERTGAVADEMANISQEIDYQRQAYSRYLAEAESIDLAENYKELVRNGAIDIESITDEDLNKKISDYKDYYEKALSAEDSIVDLDENLRQLYKDRFDMAADQFDAILDRMDAQHSLLEQYVDQIENTGHIVNERFYNLMIENQRNTIGNLAKEKSGLLDELNKALDSGAIQKYSEAWYDMQSKIDDVQQSIAEAMGTINDLNNSIRQLRWDRFDDARDTIEQLNDEADFYIDVMSRGDKLFDDKGNYSELGNATAGLRIQKYQTDMAQVAAYGKEIQEIESQLANDQYNVDLIERKQELIKAQRESARAALDEKDAIVDLVKKGIDIQLDALQDLIDKYNDSLDAAKNAYDYQKKVKEQAKEIESLEKQLNSYRGDTSEEGKATIQKLKVSLEDARSDLEDTQYDQYVSDQKDLLDSLYNSYEKTLNQRLDNIDGLVSECTDATNANGAAIRETIQQEADALGISLSGSISSIWNAYAADGKYNDQLNNMYNIGSAIQNTLANIETDIQKRYSQSAADGIIAQMKQNSTDWYTADAAGRESLHYQNVALAGQLSALTGQNTYTSDGVWRDQYGTELYRIDKEATAKEAVNKMKANAAAWASASDSDRQKLSEQSALIGSSLGSLLGRNVYRGNDGVWYIDGKRLFDVYHSGGIVGGGGLSDKERLSVLLDNEAVLTNAQLETVSDRISMLNDVVSRIGDLKIPVPAVDDAQIFGTIQSPAAPVTNTTNKNTFDITFSLPNVKSYEEFMNAITSDTKFESFVQAITVDRMAGKPRSAKDKYKW